LVNISIIIPVFNVEEYLERCLNSIFSQQFEGTFEVIAVDDASTDNSLSILKIYQLNEPRLRVIEHLANRRLSTARSSGIKHAAGEYIMHVDSDDCLLPGALKKLHEYSVAYGADVIVFNYIRENLKGERKVGSDIKVSELTFDKKNVQKLFYGACINKFVKRSIVLKMIYGQVGFNNAEDLLYSTEILIRSKSIYLTSDSLYVYYANAHSLGASNSSKEFFSDMTTALCELNKVFALYKPCDCLIKNVSDYYNKTVYFAIFGIHFLKKGSMDDGDLFLQNIVNSSAGYLEVNKFIVESSLQSKYRCLLEVFRRHEIIFIFKSFAISLLRRIGKI
jgi:glycosyltransferase involved in cell wall biosynthesis